MQRISFGNRVVFHR